MEILSVSDLNQHIKVLINKDLSLANICVKGEVSNLKKAYSGHWYFSLKDEKSLISCVMFKNYTFDITDEIENGKEVVVFGNVSVYVANGSYQIYCEKIFATGFGDKYKKFEILKEKLLKEGLFDRAHKKALPEKIKKVGLVTSLKGAAIKDILRGLKRDISLDIAVINVAVQGDNSAKEIAKAINDFNLYSENNDSALDVLIVGRGGGSFEDLFSFSEEIVARAIFASNIPIISAVGHEVDVSLADFVADVRCSTPTEAGMLVARDLEGEVSEIKIKLKKEYLNIFNRINHFKIELDTYANYLKKDILKYKSLKKELEFLNVEMKRKLLDKYKRKKEEVESLKERLLLKSPFNILEKGYTLVLDKEVNNKVLKDYDDFKIGDDIILERYDFKVCVRVLSLEKRSKDE